TVARIGSAVRVSGCVIRSAGTGVLLLDDRAQEGDAIHALLAVRLSDNLIVGGETGVRVGSPKLGRTPLRQGAVGGNTATGRFTGIRVEVVTGEDQAADDLRLTDNTAAGAIGILVSGTTAGVDGNRVTASAAAGATCGVWLAGTTRAVAEGNV